MASPRTRKRKQQRLAAKARRARRARSAARWASLSDPEKLAADAYRYRVEQVGASRAFEGYLSEFLRGLGERLYATSPLYERLRK